MVGPKMKFSLPTWTKFASFVVVLALLSAPVCAWEYSMKGEYENRLIYYARTGNNDLFGMAGLQEGPTAAAGIQVPHIGFAGPNIYWNSWLTGFGTNAADTAAGAGYRIVRGGCYNDPAPYLALHFRLEAHPKDKCEAIGFRCVKNIHP